MCNSTNVHIHSLFTYYFISLLFLVNAVCLFATEICKFLRHGTIKGFLILINVFKIMVIYDCSPIKQPECTR